MSSHEFLQSNPPTHVEDGTETRDATLSTERKSSTGSEGKSQPLQVPRRALPPRKKSSKKLAAEAKEAEQAILADTPSATNLRDESIPVASNTEDGQHKILIMDATDSVVDSSRVTSIAAEPEPDAVDLRHSSTSSDHQELHAAAVDDAGVTRVLSSEAEVYEGEDEDEDEVIGSTPALTHIEDTTDPSHLLQPKVEYVEYEQHLPTANHTDRILPISESVVHEPGPRYSLPPPPRHVPTAPAPGSVHGEDHDRSPTIPPPPAPPLRMLGVDSDEESDHQGDTWDEESSSPASRSVPPPPKPGPNIPVAFDTGIQKAEEEEYKPPPVNRASRPPIPQGYNRQTTEAIKRRSIDSAPTSPVTPQETEQPYSVNISSSKSLRRPTLPPPPIAVTHRSDVEESEKELMDEADTGTRR